MNAVDTNVLIYIHDPRDLTKQRIAIDVVNSLTDGLLLWQVGCEYLAACRKLINICYSQGQAFDDLREIQQLRATAIPSRAVFDIAEGLLSRFSLSFWDAMLLGACRQAGVKRLYSEDFDAYRSVDGIELINPFRAPAS